MSIFNNFSSEATRSPQDIYCPLPWIGLHMPISGKLRPCCLSTQIDLDLDGVPSPSVYLEKYLNSAQLKELRKNFLNGRRNQNCEQCWAAEDAGHKSMRVYINESHTQQNFAWAKKSTSIDGSVEFIAPGLLDVRPDNVCNLKCLMCGTEQSSLWGAELGVAQEKYRWSDNLNNWENLYHYIHDNKEKSYIELSFAGGEPFLNKNHVFLLKKLIDAELSQFVRLTYNSNLTVFPSFIEAHWPYFKDVILLASMDGMGSVAEYVRFPTKWPTVETYFKKFLALDYVYVVVQPCISLYNVWNLPDLLSWVELHSQTYQGKTISVEAHGHMVHTPEFLNIRNIPLSLHDKLAERFNSIEFKPWHRQFLLSTLSYLKQPTQTNYLNDFWKFNAERELKRNNSFSLAMPDWHLLLAESSQTSL
jgi:hypothetical protein